VADRIIVIGGGASGLMAAGRAAQVGARVLLLEKKAHPGIKLSLTGNGRGNLTHAASVASFFFRRCASETDEYSLDQGTLATW